MTPLERLEKWNAVHAKEPNLMPECVPIDANVEWLAEPDDVTIGDLRAIAAELRDHEQSFDLRWKSDMRAIKMWQEAHPGNDLVAVSWAGPSHDDLCVWLMELVNDGWNEGYRGLIDDVQAQVKTLRDALLGVTPTHHARGLCYCGWEQVGHTQACIDARAALAATKENPFRGVTKGIVKDGK